MEKIRKKILCYCSWLAYISCKQVGKKEKCTWEPRALVDKNEENAQKMNKYEHFITDIATRDVSVHPFEIGSREYISPSNKANLKKLHKFCKPSVGFKAMCENLSCLAVLPSCHIFRQRKTLDWDQETSKSLEFHLFLW